jgi:gliding motility-associated-like protein
MKINYKYILYLLVFLRTTAGFSQPDCTTAPPLAPQLISVSVQYETGKTKLSWTPSPSTGIAAYIIYSFKSGDGMVLDTIRDPMATSFVLNTTVSKYFSVSYVVASMRLPRCTSSFSNVVNSIFCEASLDTCNKKILISWNTYSSLKQKVTGYSIQSATDGVNFSEIASVDPAETKYTLDKFEVNSNYCFVVKANIEDGSFSSSNKICLSTRMQRPPAWINADYASVNSENKVELAFTIDPLSEIYNFSLDRKNIAAGTTRVIGQPLSVNGSISFTDNKSDIDSVYQYRLSAINSCNIPVTFSNPATNLVQSFDRINSDIYLKWNSYRLWKGQNEGYTIFTDTGNGYEEQGFVPATDTSYVLKYRDIMYKVSGNNVCFYISTKETSNPHGIEGRSQSQILCTEPAEIITVPNLFTPDNDQVNDLFRPVISFTPSQYRLVITDRHGKILFESSGFYGSWDGTESGKPVPQGVYLWYLKTTTPSGKEISKTGTVTIIRAY